MTLDYLYYNKGLHKIEVEALESYCGVTYLDIFGRAHSFVNGHASYDFIYQQGHCAIVAEKGNFDDKDLKVLLAHEMKLQADSLMDEAKELYLTVGDLQHET